MLELMLLDGKRDYRAQIFPRLPDEGNNFMIRQTLYGDYDCWEFLTPWLGVLIRWRQR